MEQKFIVVADDVFSSPMSKEDAIKAVKSYDHKGVTAYIVSEEEAKRIESPDNFNQPKWS